MFNSIVSQIFPGIAAVTFTEPFTNQTTVVVTHNLRYRPPSIMVINGSLDAIDFEVRQTSIDAFTVAFGVSQTGIILYR